MIKAAGAGPGHGRDLLDQHLGISRASCFRRGHGQELGPGTRQGL